MSAPILVSNRELEALKLIADAARPLDSELLRVGSNDRTDAWIIVNALIDRAEASIGQAIPAEVSGRITMRMRRITPSCDCPARDKPGEIHDLGCSALDGG